MAAIVQVIGVKETAADIQAMARAVPAAVGDALTRGGRWVTYEARDRLRPQITGTYLPHYPRAITSEVERSAGVFSMIVGPEAGRLQGGMGPGVEFGSRNASPNPHLFDAFDARVDSVIDRAINNITTWPGGRR